jgi:hypothetical protein
MFSWGRLKKWKYSAGADFLKRGLYKLQFGELKSNQESRGGSAEE